MLSESVAFDSSLSKKPSINIKEGIEPAFQVRRYAYTAGLPVSILTDFEEFAVYDTRIKPNKNDKAIIARIFYCTYEEYEKNFDFLFNTFSKDAIQKGKLKKYTQDGKRKKGTQPVDKELLKQIEGWRTTLERNIALRNKELDIYQLNEAVQKIIDRIIFLRIAEDRNTETYNSLKDYSEQENIYEILVKYFSVSNNKYNSGLFASVDWLDKLVVDNKILKEIITDLYYPNPYEFSVLPIEILGQIYEQFLGKTIRLTQGHQAKVEEKPEVRKAGGVYYTPQYIVEYIVKNTVGKKIQKQSPEQISTLRILDPACGSGSFLVGAFNFLLKYHLEYYTVPQRLKKALKSGAIFELNQNTYRLTIREKRNILLNNIFGVDIDPQAVEVTKLSLLLTLMEGEIVEAKRELFFKDSKEALLPDLKNNIKCGNSLIGTDFYATKDLQLFDYHDQRKINCFDWEVEFKDIIGAGGFDCVIGNPPYGASLSSEIKKNCSKRFPFVSDYETSQYFIAKTEKLLRTNGLIGFIVPNTILLNIFAKKFRRFVYDNYYIETIANLSDIDVFVGATVRTVILFMARNNKKNTRVNIMSFSNPTTTKVIKTIHQEKFNKDTEWIEAISNIGDLSLIRKIFDGTKKLGGILKISQGLIPYDKYRGHDEYTIKNRIWHSDKKLNETYKKELRGGDVKRYSVIWNAKQWISYGKWLAAPRKPEFFTQPRLLFREITDPKTGLLHVAYSDQEYYNNPGIINCISDDTNYNLFYLLGICDSRLMAYYHFSSSPKARKGIFPKILVRDVRSLPIRTIDFSNKTEKAKHDRMVSLVEQMLEAQKEAHSDKLKTETDKKLAKQRIDIIDKQIDTLVYELYGLTEEEIKIVEGE